jgi:dihydrodipicolinate synthase/N-acetylneuraminate lyase
MPDTRFPQTVLATCCVPWDEDGALLEEAFRDSIRTLVGHGFRDLYVFGTAGEGYAVDEERFDAVCGAFVEETRAAGVPPMVGVISLSLPTVIQRIERAADLGVELFQISLPSWGALNDRELAVFFAETCGRFPSLRFLHYNLPRSRRLVTPAEYARLAARHPNLVATKNAGASNATIVELFAQAPELRHFFTEPGYGYASLVGPAGFLVSVALLRPRYAHAYFEAGLARDVETLASIARDTAAIVAELQRALGGAHMDGAFDKCLSRALDPAFPLRLLPPYEGASDEAFDAFMTAVRARLPHWTGG